MTIEELNARLKELKREIVGPEPRLSVVMAATAGGVSYGVFVESASSRRIFTGHGDDLAALLNQAKEAIDEASPIMLARTLGIEPSVASAAE